MLTFPTEFLGHKMSARREREREEQKEGEGGESERMRDDVR